MALGRLALESGHLPALLASVMSLILILAGSLAWFIHIFRADSGCDGSELLRAFLVFLLFSYLLFRLMG